MRARSVDQEPFTAARRLVDAGLVGIGEPLRQPPADAEMAVILTSREHNEKSARMLERFICLPNQTLVWTRIDDDSFLLGEITGPWRYDHSSAATIDGITNVRPARWMDEICHRSAAPPGVVATFDRGGRNLQAIGDAEAAGESRTLWAEN